MNVLEVKYKDCIVLPCFFEWSMVDGRVDGRVQKSGGCVPFVQNEIIDAEIAGKQTSISLLLSGID